MSESLRKELKDNATHAKYRLVNAFRAKDPGRLNMTDYDQFRNLCEFEQIHFSEKQWKGLYEHFGQNNYINYMESLRCFVLVKSGAHVVWGLRFNQNNSAQTSPSHTNSQNIEYSANLQLRDQQVEEMGEVALPFSNKSSPKQTLKMLPRHNLPRLPPLPTSIKQRPSLGQRSVSRFSLKDRD